MGGRWRLPVCVVAVLLVHAGLAVAWLRAPVSGAQHGPLHRRAPVRLVLLEPAADPAAASPPAIAPAVSGDPAETAVPPAPGHVDPVAPRRPATAARPPALAPERAVSEPSPAAATIAPLHDFLSPAQVDRIAIAFPSPDMGQLAGLAWSGKPIRLRLFVAADGHCVDVQVTSASEEAGTLERLRQMFLATHFLPARRAGVDVDSYRDLELDVSDVK